MFNQINNLNLWNKSQSTEQKILKKSDFKCPQMNTKTK